MAIAFDVGTVGRTQAALTGTAPLTFSWSHTTAGANRLLIVGVSVEDAVAGDRDVGTVTYNGVNLTKIGDIAQGNFTTSLWYLINPAVGTNTVTVTMASGSNASLISIGAGSLSLTGVHQTTALDNYNTASSAGDTTITVNVTTIADNCWVVDNFVSDNFVRTFTIGGEQSQAYNVESSTVGHRASYEGPKTPAGSVTMSWEISSTEEWATIAASFKPATGGGGGGQTDWPKFQNRGFWSWDFS